MSPNHCSNSESLWGVRRPHRPPLHVGNPASIWPFPCLTPMFSGPFPAPPAACSWLFTLSKCCRKMLLLLNTKQGRKKKAHSLAGLCLFRGLKFAVAAESFCDPCRYLIQVTSGVWGTDTVPHRACSCTDLKYLCIHLSIHITVFLSPSLSLSVQC